MPTTTKTITALFTNAGAGATGLTLPTVKVIQVSDGSITAGTSVEINNGFYKFDFTAFDNAEDYVFEFDAGAAAIVDSRFARGIIADVREQIADTVWDELEADHLTTGTMGLAVQLVRAALLNGLDITEIDEKNFNYVIKDDGGATLLSGTISAAGAVESRSKAV